MDLETIFIGNFISQEEFEAYWEQIPIEEYFDDENGAFIKDSCKLAEYFGFNCYNDDYVDYDYLPTPVLPNDFYNALIEQRGEDRFKYWNINFLHEAIEWYGLQNGLKVNSLLKLGDLHGDSFKKNTWSLISEHNQFMFCGTYSNKTGKRIF